MNEWICSLLGQMSIFLGQYPCAPLSWCEYKEPQAGPCRDQGQIFQMVPSALEVSSPKSRPSPHIKKKKASCSGRRHRVQNPAWAGRHLGTGSSRVCHRKPLSPNPQGGARPVLSWDFLGPSQGGDPACAPGPSLISGLRWLWFCSTHWRLARVIPLRSGCSSPRWAGWRAMPGSSHPSPCRVYPSSRGHTRATLPRLCQVLQGVQICGKPVPRWASSHSLLPH